MIFTTFATTHACQNSAYNHGYLNFCFQEAFNLVQPAMQLASKIPDVHVQLWASSLLKGTKLKPNLKKSAFSLKSHYFF